MKINLIPTNITDRCIMLGTYVSITLDINYGTGAGFRMSNLIETRILKHT